VYQQNKVRNAKGAEKEKRMKMYMKMMKDNLKEMFETIIYIYNSENRIESK